MTLSFAGRRSSAQQTTLHDTSAQQVTTATATPATGATRSRGGFLRPVVIILFLQILSPTKGLVTAAFHNQPTTNLYCLGRNCRCSTTSRPSPSLAIPPTWIPTEGESRSWLAGFSRRGGTASYNHRNRKQESYQFYLSSCYLRSTSLTMSDDSNDNDSSSRDSANGNENVNSSIGKLQIYPYESYDKLIEEWNLQKQQHKGTSNGESSTPMIRTIHRIHVIRHAEGTHNVNMEYKLPINRDAKLTPKGIEQCNELSKTTEKMFPKHEKPPLIITSTMTRCIQTTLLSLPHLFSDDEDAELQKSSCGPRIIAHEGIRETVNYECDVRRSIQELKTEFPMIDFDSYSISDIRIEASNDDSETEHIDPIWYEYRQRLGHDHDKHCESAELHVVAKRGKLFFEWLVSQQHEDREDHGDKKNDNNDHIVICTHSAFLRCILNWKQTGGVPKQMPQTLDKRSEEERLNCRHTSSPLFEYCFHRYDDDSQNMFKNFESIMRRDFDNCELRSFCLVHRN